MADLIWLESHPWHNKRIDIYEQYTSRFTQVQVNFFKARDGIVMFSHFLKQFCILVQITIKGPDLLQNRS